MRGRALMLILLLSWRGACSTEGELTEEDYKKRKERYLELIGQFEEQESIQACLALSNKLDQDDHRAAVETLKLELQISGEDNLKAMNRKLVSMMIANCYAALVSMPRLTRDNVMSMVQDSRADLTEIRGLFKMDRAMESIQLGHSVDNFEQIQAIIALIDTNKQQRSNNPDQPYERARESLQAKMNLLKEMEQFESQQGLLLYGLMAVLGVWFVGLVACVKLQKRRRAEAAVEDGQTEEDKLKEIEAELARLDAEIGKAQELIQKLKGKAIKS